MSSSPHNVGRFAAAHVLSAFGFEFLTFVMTVRVFDLTGNAVGVSVFAALSFLPRLITPFFGNLADRYARNRLFACACVAACAATLATAAATDLPEIYACWFVLSALAMVLLNLRSVMLAQVIGPGGRVTGNALMLISLNTARLAAPPAGALAGTVWSASGSLVVAALIYVAAAASGLLVRLPRVPARPGSSRVLKDIRGGASILWTDGHLAFLASTSVLWRLSLGFQGSLLIIYVDRVLRSDMAGYGLLMAVLGAGSLIGSFAGPWVCRCCRHQTVVVVGLVFHFILSGGLGLVSDYRFALMVGFAGQFALYTAAVAIHALRDEHTPSDHRGRAYGCITAATAVATALSTLVGGYLADTIGIAAVFSGGGLLALAGLGLTTRLVARPPALSESSP